MKKIALIALCMVCTVWGMAQDTVLNRNVTVEREFQPVIQDAGKINQRPQIVETQLEPVDVTYSDYVLPLSPSHNVTSLLSQPTRFATPDPLEGLIRAGFGHTGILLDLRYVKDDDARNILKVYANHDATWGRKASEKTRLGFDFRHKFSASEMYFGVEGSNVFYSRYARYFDGDKGLTVKHFSDMKDSLARQNIWQGGAHMGVRSLGKGDVQYDVQVGYNAYHMVDWATEHQVRVHANIHWVGGEHRAGVNVNVQDMFYALHFELPEGKTNNPRHALFLEPYYEYVGKRVFLHAGVNLNTVFGKGTLMAKAGSDISFAPSPNVYMEAQIAPKWLSIYANAKGSFANGSLQNAVNANRYMTIAPILYSHHVGPYTPVDAELGFHIKAHKNLLVELHAGYAYQMNQKIAYATLVGTGVNLGMLDYFYCNMDRWKVGATVSYHYKDIVNVHVWGDYYIWSLKNSEFDRYFPVETFPTHARAVADRVYDRPNWQIGMRVDGRIDNNWSLYTELDVRGTRWAITSQDASVSLKPYAEWNLGCRYDWKYNLGFWLELNNVICRYNDLFYGYQTEGTNFLLGLTWKF